ncbi:MAG TPA: hypothetical protein VHT91_00545 [Kofleriaceae bacterium]|nr:hypothetical protein [Kofleriaceae bacterium]
MKRYFESFFNHDPMHELSEAAAREAGSYAVEDDPAMRRYHRVIDHQLDSIVYKGWNDPTVPLMDLGRLGEPVDAEIHSTVKELSEGAYSWRIWYIDPQRRIIKILEPEFAADGSFLRESLRGPDGKLISYTIYHYDRDGYLLELVTHAPDGTVTSRQDA